MTFRLRSPAPALHSRLLELESEALACMLPQAPDANAAAAEPNARVAADCAASNRIFYFAIPPSIYAEVAAALSANASTATGR